MTPPSTPDAETSTAETETAPEPDQKTPANKTVSLDAAIEQLVGEESVPEQPHELTPEEDLDI